MEPYTLNPYNRTLVVTLKGTLSGSLHGYMEPLGVLEAQGSPSHTLT